jgi:rhamnogalacturonan endolyase
MLQPIVLLLSIVSLASSVSATFGFTKSGNNYVIDAGSADPLVFTVSGTSCDITSIKYRSAELQGQTKGSHISSGLGTATVSVTQVTGSELTWSF